MSQICIKILVTGSVGVGKSSFIRAANEFLFASSSLEMLKLKQVTSEFPIQRYYKKKGAIILYDVTSMQSFQQALALASDINIPKVILANKLDMGREVHFNYAKTRSHEVSAAYYQVCIQTFLNIKNSLELIKEAIQMFEMQKNQRKCKFRLKYKNVQRVRKLNLGLSLFNAITSIMLVILGTIQLVEPIYDRPPQVVTDAMIFSGLVTFFISFIGWYGLMRSGIKEYLKSYYKTLIGLAFYKGLAMIIYIKNQIVGHDVTIPLLVLSIFFDILTSSCTFVYNNAVMKVRGKQVRDYANNSISIFQIKHIMNFLLR